MNIAVLFAGILRTDLEETIQNVSRVCNNFKDHNVKSYFVTWSIPNKIANEIKDNVDFFHMVDEPEIDWVVENVPNFVGQKKNKPPLGGGSYLNIYYMLKCRQAAVAYLNESGFIPDYTLLIRNDAFLRIENLNEWLNNEYNTSSLRHSRRSENRTWGIPSHQVNDHFVFARHEIINNTFNKDDEFFKNIISKTSNAEGAVLDLIKGAETKRHYMKFDDYYLLDGINGCRHIYRDSEGV